MSAPSLIAFEGVAKRFGSTLAVDDVSFSIEEGEFFALLGPSGCGKTTLLRLLAGLETPSAGRLLIDGADVGAVPPHRRPVTLVFQSYAVFPHMSVAENVAFGLRVDRVPSAERNRRVEEALALVKLEDLGTRRPHQLSGGQKQRVALARALIKRPRVLLLDEPLSALDARLRETMRAELTQLQKQVGITFLFVTHDQDEALAMAGRCAVMNEGALEQVAKPEDLYERPDSRFVADFIGRANLFPGVLRFSADGGAVFVSPALTKPIATAARLGAVESEPVWMAVRPESINISPDQRRGAGVAGTVQQIAYLGGHSVLEVNIGHGEMVRVRLANRGGEGAGPAQGERVWLSWRPEAARLLWK